MARDRFPPDDWPPEARARSMAHIEATMTAIKRIRRERRRLSQAQAEEIIREEARVRGIRPAGHVVRETARVWLRPPWWPWLHPVAARREGYRFVWEKSSDE